MSWITRGARLFCGFAACWNTARAAPLDLVIVLDIDDVLARVDARGWTALERHVARASLVQGDRSLYRWAHGAHEFVQSLDALRAYGIRVTIGAWSAYERDERNRVLCESFAAKEGGVTCMPFSFVHMSKDVDRFPDVPTHTFLQRQPPYTVFEGANKKNLSKVPVEKGRTAERAVLLIDDVPGNVAHGQERQFVWARNSHPTLEFARLRGLLELAAEWRRDYGLSLPDALWTAQWEEDAGSTTIRYRTELAESLDVVARGLAAFQRVNASFAARPESLAPLFVTPAPLALPRPNHLVYPRLTTATSQKFANDRRLRALHEFFTTGKAEPLFSPPELGEVFWFRDRWMRVTDRWIREEERCTELQVVDVETQTKFVLRVGTTPEARAMLARLVSQGLPLLAAHRIAAAQPVDSGDGWLLVPQLAGITARQWLTDGHNDPKFRAALLDFVEQLLKRDLYVAGVHPEDMVWNGSGWELQRSGRVHDDMDASKLRERFHNKFVARWGVSLFPPPPPTPPLLPPAVAAILPPLPSFPRLTPGPAGDVVTLVPCGEEITRVAGKARRSVPPPLPEDAPAERKKPSSPPDVPPPPKTA